MRPLSERATGMKKDSFQKAQAAIEYLLLLGAVVVVVLMAFKTLIPKHQNAADGYFNAVERGIYGAPAIYNNLSGNTIDRLRTGGFYP